jgi:hypothetical protein
MTRMGSPPIEQVTPGAQLVVRNSVYRHHGIYAGGGRVIHYAGWIRGRRGLIEEISLDEFAEGRDFKVNLSPGRGTNVGAVTSVCSNSVQGWA